MTMAERIDSMPIRCPLPVRRHEKLLRATPRASLPPAASRDRRRETGYSGNLDRGVRFLLTHRYPCRPKRRTCDKHRQAGRQLPVAVRNVAAVPSPTVPLSSSGQMNVYMSE